MPIVKMSATQQDAQSLMSRVETVTAPSCGVLSLPIIEFPESPPVNGMLDYDELWPYVSSAHLRFSYGVIKKSIPSGFQAQFAGEITADSLQLLRDGGICGVLIDTFGYPDGAKALSASLQSLTGSDLLVSPAGRWEYLSIAAK